jgi:hypothetical protein
MWRGACRGVHTVGKGMHNQCPHSTWLIEGAYVCAHDWGRGQRCARVLEGRYKLLSLFI